MSNHPKIHALLIARQSLGELKRKADKARGRSIWSQEEIDYSARYGLIMHLRLSKVLNSAKQYENTEKIKQRAMSLCHKDTALTKELYFSE